MTTDFMVKLLPWVVTGMTLFGTMTGGCA